MKEKLLEHCNKYEKQLPKLKLEELKEIVEQRHPGSEFLSTEYVNTRTKVRIRCKEGHDFEIVPYNLKRSQWCKKCSYHRKKIKKRTGRARILDY